MSLPVISSREDWLVARKELLAREKQLTRQRDALNRSSRNWEEPKDRVRSAHGADPAFRSEPPRPDT
jgi:predicted dithiol-disulfide oxidoreductase (DUF899 family)